MKFNDCQSASRTTVEEVFDLRHVRLTLNPIGDGGEATVSTCAERPGSVVKVYHPDLIADDRRFRATVDRLNALAAKTRLMKHSALAWPEEPVYDATGRLAGYVMKKVPEGFIRFSSIFGGVKSVRKAFPSWNRRDLALTALNFVNVLAILEKSWVMPADFNPDNFLVNEYHELFFIDCDSYQVRSSRGVVTSETYFESMAAPELLCNGLKGRPRTPEQTHWSAAVMVFRLLMCGMHPFQYVDSAQDGTMAGSVVANIKAGKCPLGCGADCRFASEWAALWSWLTGKMKDVFITTFRREANHGWGEPKRRAPLDVIAGELKRLLYEMGRSEERTMLCPPSLKAREYVQLAAFRPTSRNF